MVLKDEKRHLRLHALSKEETNQPKLKMTCRSGSFLQNKPISQALPQVSVTSLAQTLTSSHFHWYYSVVFLLSRRGILLESFCSGEMTLENTEKK